MPFDFKKYDAKCAAMNVDELHLEWQHYTRLTSGASASTAVSGIAVPFTLGVSTVGVAVAAPPRTPQIPSQNCGPPLQFQNRYDTVQLPASYAATPAPMIGSYSGQPNQTSYGYPTPAPTPHAQYPEKSYFNQSHHG